MIVESVAFGSKDYFQSLSVRDLVLRQPLGLSFSPQQLSLEKDDVHVVAKIGNRVVGTMILSADAENAKMRQVAVLPEFQSTGIGKSMVAFFEQEARNAGYGNIVLHARENAIRFYENQGYIVASDWFEEVGIPHKKMVKRV